MAVLGDLDETALVEVLTTPKNSLLKQYQKLFEYESVELVFEREALAAIAQMALERKVGARGLRMIMEELMLDLMYYLPSFKRVKQFVVTRKMVEDHDLRVGPAGKSRLTVYTDKPAAGNLVAITGFKSRALKRFFAKQDARRLQRRQLPKSEIF